MIYNRSLQDFFDYSEINAVKLIPFLLGRNAFNYLIKSLEIKVVMLPAFICPIVIDIFKNHGIKIFFYTNLDEHLEVPIDSIIELVSEIENAEQVFFVWHDYLNLIGDIPNKLYEVLDKKNICSIIDATHSLPINDYKSPYVIFGFRKLLNQPFGAFIKTNLITNKKNTELSKIKLIKFFIAHKIKTNILLFFKSIDNHFVDYFLKKINMLCDYYSFDKKEYFINNSYNYNKILNFHRVLDYNEISKIRRKNFEQYCKNFPNTISLNNFNISCPFGFPLLVKNNKLLRSHLWSHGVHTFLLWEALHKDVLTINDKGADYLSKSIIILPVNQDLSSNEINKISKIINEY